MVIVYFQVVFWKIDEKDVKSDSWTARWYDFEIF